MHTGWAVFGNWPGLLTATVGQTVPKGPLPAQGCPPGWGISFTGLRELGQIWEGWWAGAGAELQREGGGSGAHWVTPPPGPWQSPACGRGPSVYGAVTSSLFSCPRQGPLPSSPPGTQANLPHLSSCSGLTGSRVRCILMKLSRPVLKGFLWGILPQTAPRGRFLSLLQGSPGAQPLARCCAATGLVTVGIHGCLQSLSRTGWVGLLFWLWSKSLETTVC